MAVYNGFSTRKKEGVYNELTFELMEHLQEQILMGWNNKEVEREAWVKEYRSVIARMNKMEKEKFMPPRYSQACEELSNELKITNIAKNVTPEKELPIIHGKNYSATISRVLKKKFLGQNS